MKSIQPVLVAAALVLGSHALGCAWVSIEPGAEKVGILTEDAARGCKRLGKTTANTTASVGFIPRSESRVREELRSIARNAAVRMGGDAVAPLGPIEEGVQEFGIYRCAPDEPVGTSTPDGSG